MRNTERKPCENEVVSRIETVLKTKGITQKELILYLDISPSTFTRWKYDNGKSYTKYLNRISGYLGVSTDYLLKGDSGIGMYTYEEEQLVSWYRKISNEDKNAILCIIKSLAESTKVLS